jgi:hypothetical protein
MPPAPLLPLVASAVLAAAVAAQVPPPDVDGYLCYHAAAAASSPAPRTLLDAFPPAVDVALGRVATVCTPAEVDGTAAVHPSVHQVGYRFRPRKHAGAPSAVVLDRFGTHTVILGRADRLLVPASAVPGPGGAPPYGGGTSVDHYVCYRAKAAVGTQLPVDVDDPLLPAPLAVSPRRVTRLCLPASKNDEDPSAPAHPGHLLCRRVRPGGAVAPATVSTNDQIGAATLGVSRPLELCLPALRDPGATTSTTTSTTTSSTTSSTAPLPCGDPAMPGPPICWGTCPPATPICASGPSGCACVAGSTPCGSAAFPACDGVCGPGEACMVSLTLGCTCQFQGTPCALTYPQCGGLCPDGDECVPVSTPDGNGCLCIPPGSTCLDSSPGCGGTCPVGETCTPQFGGICLCSP